MLCDNRDKKISDNRDDVLYQRWAPAAEMSHINIWGLPGRFPTFSKLSVFKSAHWAFAVFGFASKNVVIVLEAEPL